MQMFAYVYVRCFSFYFIYFFGPELHSSLCDTAAAAAAETEEEEEEGTGTASPDWRYEASQSVCLCSGARA